MMDFGGAKHQNKKLKLLLVGAAILIVLLAILAGFLFWRYNDGKKNDDGEAKSRNIISQVEELFMLPRGEDPTVAEIQDLDKLKGQEFFASAKNGDYVLIYSKAKVAFLYRESEGKLVNVGPIKTEDNAADQTQTGE